VEVLFCVYCGVSTYLFFGTTGQMLIQSSLVIECLVIYFFFVETKGPTLKEIAILFDGPNSAAGFAQSEAGVRMEKSGAEHKEG
jgi:hypothetical protein